jgi:hypothetical protein
VIALIWQRDVSPTEKDYPATFTIVAGKVQANRPDGGMSATVWLMSRLTGSYA